MTGHRPHDLLLLAAGTADARAATTPAWVRASLRETPWVVVRRGHAPPGHVAVGVRGIGRSERFPWSVPYDEIDAATTPEDLATVDATDGARPALGALAGVRDLFQLLNLPWGPTGSVGFELATGRATVTTDSDLDLVVRVDDPSASTFDRLVQLHAAFALVPVRVDCQVELPRGAVALAELVSARAPVLVRTHGGPSLAGVSDLFR